MGQPVSLPALQVSKNLIAPTNYLALAQLSCGLPLVIKCCHRTALPWTKMKRIEYFGESFGQKEKK
ncbi:hypothetical protein C8B47_29675 [filamentous cyanobacterium CCP4]|nr:hypothetical protein C8B47_29675 [filamentous cyanobacterium CCP4]